jgi:hypothetical protein
MYLGVALGVCTSSEREFVAGNKVVCVFRGFLGADLIYT